MDILLIGSGVLRRILQRIGPYLLVELLLPGGTVLALGMFVYRRSRQAATRRAASGGWIWRRVDREASDACRQPRAA